MLLDALRDGAILDAFHAESDRGAILVATSLLDTTLEKILRAVFVGGFEKRLLAHDGAAGTFSSRINLAFAMGLLHGANTAKQLHRMREIRNVCAHSLETVTFNTAGARSDQRAKDLADREELPLDEARQRITAMRKRLIDQSAGQSPAQATASTMTRARRSVRQTS